MDARLIDEAILAHLYWVTRFENFLQGIDRDPFDPEQLRDPHRCELGHLLAANATDFNRHGNLEDIHRLHNGFHRFAAELASMARTSRRAEVQANLNQLNALSNQLIDRLIQARG